MESGHHLCGLQKGLSYRLGVGGEGINGLMDGWRNSFFHSLNGDLSGGLNGGLSGGLSGGLNDSLNGGLSGCLVQMAAQIVHSTMVRRGSNYDSSYNHPSTTAAGKRHVKGVVFNGQAGRARPAEGEQEYHVSQQGRELYLCRL